MATPDRHIQNVRRYQARNAVAGLCKYCKDRARYGRRCEFHYRAHLAQKRQGKGKA